jgi:hypothetical protein
MSKLIECTDNEREILEKGLCPSCGHAEFLAGPCAGMCQNIKCDHCCDEYNVGPLTAQRIMKDEDSPDAH